MRPPRSSTCRFARWLRPPLDPPGGSPGGCGHLVHPPGGSPGGCGRHIHPPGGSPGGCGHVLYPPRDLPGECGHIFRQLFGLSGGCLNTYSTACISILAPSNHLGRFPSLPLSSSLLFFLLFLRSPLSCLSSQSFHYSISPGWRTTPSDGVCAKTI